MERYMRSNLPGAAVLCTASLFLVSILLTASVADTPADPPVITGMITLTLNHGTSTWYTLSYSENGEYYNTATWQNYRNPETGTDFLLLDFYAFPDEKVEFDGPFFEITLLIPAEQDQRGNHVRIHEIVFSPSGNPEDYYTDDNAAVVTLWEFLKTGEDTFSAWGSISGILLNESDRLSDRSDERFFEFNVRFRVERIGFDIDSE